MAVGKNKRMTKGKKGSKKKAVDPFTKKEWYDVKAPSMFTKRQIGKTLVTKSQGTRLASDGLKGRVFEVSLGDLQEDEDRAFRKMKLKVEDVQGKFCLTQFHSMTFTTDKLRWLVRKWQSLIEAVVEVKTTDGFGLRLFCIGFTKKDPEQLRKTCYAQSSQIRAIRKKMVEVIMHEASTCDLKQLVDKFIPESIGVQIEKACRGIYPLQSVFIHKAKIIKAPKFDLTKLMEVHGDVDYAAENAGSKMDRLEEKEGEEGGEGAGEEAPVAEWGDS